MSKYKIRYNEGTISSTIEEKEIEASEFEIIANDGTLCIQCQDIEGNLVSAFSNVLSVEKIKEGE